MKVFVCTEQTQGERSNDFCWVPESELVTFGSECDGGFIDDNCGCKRSMSGVKCLKATTTFKVVESEINVQELALAIKEGHYDGGGWSKYLSEAEVIAYAKEDAEELARLAGKFVVGSVLEKRGRTFRARAVPQPVPLAQQTPAEKPILL